MFTNSSFILKKDSSAYTIPVEYVTTYFNNNDVVKIAPKDQLSSSFVPALEAIDYQESNWKGYTTIALDLERVNIDTVSSSKKLESSAPKDWKKITLKHLLRLECGVGLTAQSAYISNGIHQLNIDNLSFDKSVNSSQIIYGYYASFAYRLNNLNALYWTNSDILVNDYLMHQNEIGYKRTIPIKTIGKDILFEVDGAWQWGEVGYSLGSTSSTQHFNFGGKTFKQEKIQAYTGVNTYGFKANGTLSIQLSNRLYLDLTGAYLYPLNSSDVIILKEQSGFFLTRKTALETLDNNTINYSIDGTPSTSSNIDLNNWSLSVGIKIKY